MSCPSQLCPATSMHSSTFLCRWLVLTVLQHTGASSPTTVNYEVTRETPKISVSKTDIIESSSLSDKSDKDYTLSVRNVGTGPLTISEAKMVSSTNNWVVVTKPSSAIAKDASGSVQLTFKPSVLGVLGGR